MTLIEQEHEKHATKLESSRAVVKQHTTAVTEAEEIAERLARELEEARATVEAKKKDLLTAQVSKRDQECHVRGCCCTCYAG